MESGPKLTPFVESLFSHNVESATVFRVLLTAVSRIGGNILTHFMFKEMFFLLYNYNMYECVPVLFLPLMSLSARHSQIMFNYECFSVINVNADLHGVLCRGSDILYFT